MSDVQSCDTLERSRYENYPNAGTKSCLNAAVHRYDFCQSSFRWIYYYGSNKSTGKETDLCAELRSAVIIRQQTLIGAIITCLHADKEGNMARER